MDGLASLLYSKRVLRSPRLPLLLLTLLLTGCAARGPSVLLDPRVTPADPALADLATRYGTLADRLQAHAAFYEHEVRKNHTKMRVMGVLSILGAGGAAATSAAAFNPNLPDLARPGLTSVSVSLSVLSGVFVLLPHAHQYILKEAGYQRMAEQTRQRYDALEATCGPASGSDSSRDALERCVLAAQDAVSDARRFPLDSPCKPPPERDLERMLARAR